MSTTTSQDQTVFVERNLPLQSVAALQMKRLKRRNTIIIVSGRIFFLALFIGAWQVASMVVDPLFICSPLAVFQQLGS